MVFGETPNSLAELSSTMRLHRYYDDSIEGISTSRRKFILAFNPFIIRDLGVFQTTDKLSHFSTDGFSSIRYY